MSNKRYFCRNIGKHGTVTRKKKIFLWSPQSEIPPPENTLVYILLVFYFTFSPLKYYAVWFFFFFPWPHVVFENTIFRLHNVQQDLNLCQPFSFVTTRRHLNCCHFPLMELRLWCTSSYINFCVHLWLCPQIPRNGLIRSKKIICLGSWWAQPNCPLWKLNGLHCL